MLEKNHFLTLSLSFILLFSYVHSTCFSLTPTGFEQTNFYTDPTNVTIEACDFSNENSCCSPDLSRLIGTYTDTWTSNLLHFFSYTTTPCKGAIQGLSCVLCSADQSTFVRNRNSNGVVVSQYHLCNSYCESVFSSCSNSRKSGNNEIITDVYNNASDFCYDLFDTLIAENVQLFLDTTSQTCWDDVPACTADSYYGEYTQCIGGSRSIVYQKKPEEKCNGGVPTPPTETGLPCALSCPQGQYASSHGCAACTVGHYSLGSAIREDSWQDWSSLNVPFTTYCTYFDVFKVEHLLTDVECGWEMGGFEINSGALNNSQSSYLETSVILLDDGTLTFDFRVDSELHYDGLTVLVDREIVLEKQSQVFDYTLQTVNLTAGYHFIQFVYSKDQSISAGADKAFLNLVQITPVNYAADACTPCRAGRYQNSTGKSYCNDCPMNTYSSEGAFRCTKCPPNYYSFEGSSSCSPQQNCTENDVYYLYDECYYAGGELKQNMYPVWNSPHICYDAGNTVPPYDNVTIDCVPCNPGTFRSGTTCAYCPNGFASEHGEECEICPAGTAAIKALYLDHFDSWGSGLTTDCSYFCGTDGWELHNDYIDSGTGHGRYVNSNLYLSVVLPHDGMVIFEYQLNCSVDCALDFQFTNGTGGSFRGGPNYSASTAVTAKYKVSAGEVQFRWIFTKNDNDGIGRLDNARLNYITVTSVETGGAVTCTSCAAGYYSANAGSNVCSPCPAGYFSAENATECTRCPDNTFNPKEAQSSCIACGENTVSNEDFTDCEVTCTFTDDNNLQYDISPMKRNDNEMYGPIYDFLNQVYYLNMCTREHNDNTCVDVDGDPIITYACQVTTGGIGENLGIIFGMTTLRNSDHYEHGGLTVHLTHGDTCRNITSGGTFNRQTFIDVICDPNAGVGSPLAIDPQDNIIETSKCVYEFSWKSLYGCHICTEDDYTYVITACNNDQKRYIQYSWVDNPKTCHGGVELPENQELSCTNINSQYCPPGEFLDLSIPEPVCKRVDAGFFSIGGGAIYDAWDPLPSGFSTTGWYASDEGIQSSEAETVLYYLADFVEDGSLTFTYRLYGYGDSTGGFSVYANEEIVFGPILSSNGTYLTHSLDITAGHQIIKFVFSGGVNQTNGGDGIGAVISEIVVVGTFFAAEYQYPCPAGTYSPAFSSSCYNCPENTYSYEAAGECTACPDGYYSSAGSSYCSPKIPCTDDDYQLIYSKCNNGNKYGLYIPLQPSICDDSNYHHQVADTKPCSLFDCEPGEYHDDKNNDSCASCDAGYYWNSEKKKCDQSSPGYAGILTRGWYNAPEYSLPGEFITSCVGNCSSATSGWRSRSTYLDTGVNDDRQVDVYLDITFNLVYAGSISFEYVVSGDINNGFYAFVNGRQQNLVYHPYATIQATLDLTEPGITVVRFVYHQKQGLVGSVTLKNIVVIGSGASTEQIACPAGTYSSDVGSNTCYPCAPGTSSSSKASTKCNKCSSQTFSEFEGATSCQACGSLTTSNNDRTDCTTDCSFEHKGSTIDLSPLIGDNGPFHLKSSQNQLWLNVCNKQTSKILCIDSVTGQSISTYSCLVDSIGQGTDAGRLLSASVNDDGSVQMKYSNGGVTSKCSSPIVTSLLMVCNATDDTSEPFELSGSTACNLKLQWNIAFACPLCTDDDYVKKTSDCENKKQTVAYMRVNDCYGPLIKDSKEVSCKTPVHIPVALIVSVSIVIVILVVCVAIILIWNRLLQRKLYSALKQNKEGAYEMSEIPESIAEEEDEGEEN